MTESNDVKPVKPQPKSGHDAPRSHTLREKRNAMICPYVETSPNVAQTVRFLGKRVPACVAADRNHQLHRLGLPIVCLQTIQNSCGWQKSATKRRRIDELTCTPTKTGGRTKMLTLGCPNARNGPFWFLRTKYSSKPNAMWSMILTHSFAGRAEKICVKRR